MVFEDIKFGQLVSLANAEELEVCTSLIRHHLISNSLAVNDLIMIEGFSNYLDFDKKVNFMKIY